MPNASNEDLMQLIHRVIKKVDKMEEKLDQLLFMFTSKKRKKQKAAICEDDEEIDYSFRFSPIKNDNELDIVSKKLDQDPQYLRNARLFMQSKESLKLQDIFAEQFLYHYNQSGTNGKKSLEGLLPFEQIYVYLKSKNGETDNEIKRAVHSELIRLKNRINKRKSLSNKMKQSNLETSSIDMETEIEETSFHCKTETHEEFVDVNEMNDSVDEDSTMESKISTQPAEVYIEDTQATKKDPDEIEDDFDYDFRPIDNDRELEIVSQKIKTDPQYLKQLRLQMVVESDDGHCSLEQLFSFEFLQNYNLFGARGNKKLIDLVPYKAVYVYLKKHMGLPLKVIEQDATNEIKKIKNRLACRRKLKRKRGELEPYVKSSKVKKQNSTKI